MTDDRMMTAEAGLAGQDGCPPLSVWATAQRDARTQRRGRYLPESMAHPGKMLPAIAAAAITRYTAPGDLVADPMCGIGTTLAEAVYLGRDALGVEFEGRWARIAAANITHARQHGAPGHAQVIQGDARQLRSLLPPAAAGTAALILTSPPYGPSIHGQVKAEARSGGGGVTKFDNIYGTDPANLASRRLDDLLAGFGEILAAARTLLRPSGTAVVTTRPWRQRGELVDFPGAVLAAGTAAGLIPVDRCVALLAGIHGSRLIARPSFFQLDNTRKARAQGKPWHLIAHEDVLVFREPGFPGSSRELKGPQREPEQASQEWQGPGTRAGGQAGQRAA
jgi:modification methylase